MNSSERFFELARSSKLFQINEFGIAQTLTDRILPSAVFVDEKAKAQWMAANKARQAANALKTFLTRQRKLRRIVQ